MKNDAKYGILVGAAPLGAESKTLLNILQNKDCVSAAADGGLSFFMENRIAPDYWIGDGDSLGEERLKEAAKLFPDLSLTPCSPIKDDTDMRLGMEKLTESGVQTILLFGVFGGERLDHTIANLQLMHEFAARGFLPIGVEEKSFSLALRAGTTVQFGIEEEGVLSVFSLTPESLLSIRDLFYEYEGVLTNQRVVGVSNSFAGKGGSVCVKEGVALVVRNRLLTGLDDLPEITVTR